VGHQPKKLTVGFKKLPRRSKEEKKKIYYKKLVESNICGLRYRGGKKVTVRLNKKLTGNPTVTLCGINPTATFCGSNPTVSFCGFNPTVSFCYSNPTVSFCES